MKDYLLSKNNRWLIALIGVMVLSVGSAYAGTAYSDGRAYLRQGSPTGAGKVYVSTSSSTPAASSYKACNTVQTSETTTPSASAQVSGEKKTTTYYFWATANAGYIFTGWYDSNGNLLNSGAANISKSITSGQAGSSDTHAYLDLHASFIKQIQMSFVVPTNGSFTINHNGSAVANYASFATEGKVVLTATPDDGYKLRGWYTTTNGGATKKYVAFGTTYEPNFTSNVTIGADFVPDDGKATFWNKNNGKIYDNLNTANSEASSGQVIVAVNDGVLGAGTYTIKAGVTLLIPFDETYNLMTTPKVNHMASGTSSLFLFRKLTLADGAIINCSGNICVGGQMASVNGGQPSSYPMGACGMLDLSRGGTINLKSGAVLYAWGFVKGQDMDQGNNTEASGVGKIVAESDATVWEDFQVGEWRGGTASSTIYSNKSSWKFFPFQSYTIQNVEVPVEYQTGSKLKCYWAIFGNGQTFAVPFTAVGDSDDKPLFVLGTGGTLKKWYDPTTDRVCYELGGGASIDAIQLTVMGESVSSSDYYLPIPANMHIALKSGCTLNLTKPMTMHAGSVVEVKSGATLNIQARVHMFDQEDWGTYCMYAYYYRTYRNLTSHYDRGNGTSKANLEDATLVVDGAVNVSNQMLYATQHGANICGNGGGTFKYGSLPSNTTMTQCTTLSDANSVNIRSANLHNDNDSYTKGVASTTFKNVNGRWFTNANSTWKSDKTFNFIYIKSGDVYGTSGTNGTVKACYSKDKTGLVLRDKWANVKAQGCSGWFVGLDDDHLYNYTRNTAWHQYIKTGSTTTGEGEEAVTTDTYVGSDGKMLYKTDCEFVEEGAIDANCLYTVDGVKNALVNGSFIAVTVNASPDHHAYHATATPTNYYLCFDGCVWHPATRNAENHYTVDGTVYIWYGDQWLAVQYDSTVSLYYSLSETNVKIYYSYDSTNHIWVLATPVAEVVTSAGTEQVFSLATAITKAKAGGTNVTIRLLKNISGTISYDGTNNCGLDLNGFTLSSSSNNMITVNHASANFIIKDQSAAGTGKIKAEYSSSSKINGLKVTKGHIILNSGTVHVKNTHATAGATGVTVVSGYKFTINGGTLEVESKGETWGVYTESSTTSVVTVNGGTIDASTTSASGDNKTSAIYGLGGNIIVNGGTLNGRASATYARGIYLNSASPKLTINGGTITATAPNTIYGLHLIAGATATVNDGTITATATGGTVRGILSYGTLTMNGGTVNASAGGSDSRALFLRNNTSTINAGTVINATAASNAYGIYYDNGTPTVTVNNGTFTVSTTSTTGAYGVYAAKGTGTINDGTFTVTAKTTGAEGMHVETANTPQLTLNGGKFMVKNSNGSADGTINNTGATLANFSMAGGYFNIAPNGTTNIAAGKTVKDLDATVEASLISAGYTKKIAGTEYTVTFKTRPANGSGWVTTTIKVESGKVPVYPDGTPIDYASSTTTARFSYWRDITDSENTTDYEDGLPAVGAADVTYQARYTTLYAQVTWGGNDSIFTNPKKAWNFAITKQQATIKLLSNYGTEAAGGTMTQLLFNPTNANSIITFDLNGHSWVHGSHGTASENKNVFLDVSPAQANCKLIITDNSASGNGYLMNKQAYSANLLCVNVTAGELLLQGGAIKVNNTSATNNAVGVQANGGVFNMIGGTVESKKESEDVTGGTASAVYAYSATNLSGGTIKATNTKGAAIGTYVFRNTFTTLLSDSIHVITNGSQSYAVHGYGSVEVSGGTYDVTAEKVSPATWSTARGVYMCQSSSTYFGKATVKGNPVFNVTGVSGAAYGVYSYNHADVESVVEGGTFNVTTTGAGSSIGVTAHDQATTTVKGGTFNVSIPNAAYEQCFGAYAQTNGIVNIEGGTFTVSPTYVGGNNDCARISGGDDTQLNISGGTFTSTNCAYGVRCFNGTTRISGNPVFSARYGVDVATWATTAGNHTATVIVDGGTFIATTGSAIRSNKNERVVSEVAYNVYGDMTVWDGKFYSGSNQPIDASSGTSYLKIRGGYYSTYTSSNVSNLNKYVVSPSTVEAYATTIDGKDYTYRVNTKYNVIWSVGGVNDTVQYNRNETPSYGSTPVYPGTTDTYEFLGWDKAIVPVTEDVTYTAQFQKWEAEVTVPGTTGSKKYTSFVTAFNEAQNLPVATIKVLSNVYYSTALTLNPDSAGGSKPLTIDLNNHVVNYTPATATYALTINKAGCKLIIDDSSVAKGGQFGHKQTANNGATISAIYIQNGELELAGGTIIAQNNNTDASTDNSKGTRAVVGNSGTVFTMTGGKLYAKSRFDARAFNSGGTCMFNATGGTIEATCEYTDGGTKWGNNAYGVVLWNYGTFNMSGTASMSVTSATGAVGVYPYGAGGTGYPVANISGGSMTCLTKTGGGARPINLYGSHSKATISGGDITANGPAGQWNIECVYCDANATADITGGNFHSTDGGGYCTGVRVFAGTVNISGNPYFDSRHGVVVGDYATTTADATVYVNGGTFNCPQYVFYATSNTRDGVGTVTGRIYVNGGYFKTASGNNICYTGSGTSNLILHGGYYNETSGTTQKSNITTYKGATTEVSTLSPAITVDGRTYHYQLLTDFNITWTGGDSYSKVTTLKSGTMPTNTDLDGKCFLRNDSAFYFTGWSPTPSAVTGDATYTALGVYHEAKVTVSAQDSIFDNFDEAWEYAMDQASATITLLTNLTRTSSIIYNPTPANARHTFDLNNFTIKENTTDRLLFVNKADAKLTITDNSSAKGGCLYKKMDSSANICTSVIYHGELILAGGKLYVENTKDEKVWHPAECVHVSRSTDGIFTMTGGTVESQAKYLAYPLYNYATMNISGGTIIANATTQGAAQGLYAVAGTATISGGTWNISSTTSGAVGVAATGWVNTTGTPRENGTLNITGGTFNISAATSNVVALQANATGKEIEGTIYKAHGIINVSGGTFNVTCSAATANQVFAAQCNGWRLFDNALPHTMRAEERAEMNISGGTFTVDTRDNGAWVTNGGNVDLLRSWGTMNVTGGNFTIYQNNSSPSAIGVFRGKTTVSGNPVFNVYGHTSNAYAVCAGYWTHENYCDKDAANNLAEAEINGGTFKIITEGQNINVIYSLGQISAESRDGDSITAHAGYAMNAKITVNGGEFLGICPNESGKYPIMLNSRVDLVGTYGTAKSEIYVTGGKFKSRKGTEADNTTSGAVNCHNNVGTLLLTGGYYETSGQLSAQKADTCDIINITSADIDPEYNNGYRYRIDVHYVAQVTATGVDRKFATLKGALDYAKTLANSTVTLLDDCNFETDGQYGYALGTTGKTMTIDLNNHTVNATNSETSYDRVFAVTGQITVTDNSVAKGGKLNLTKAHNGTFLGIVFNDASQLTLANGTIYVENTTASKAVEALNIWGTTGIFRQTGGTLQAKATSATATGIQMRGTAEISGGNVIVTSDGSYAKAFVPAADAANSKYGSITVSGTPTITVSGAGEVSGVYANVAGTTTTISGGTWNITSTTSTAYGVRLSNASASASISGGTFNVTTTTTSAYCVYASTSASATVTGGTYNATATTTNAYGVYVYNGGSGTVSGGTFTSRTGANKNESFGAYATGTGTTLNITGGTFDVNSADNAGGNINVVRVQPGATVTISGGTFRSGANNGYGLLAFGGVTTVSGTALFEAQTGAYVGSWYSGDGTNDELATVNLNGGTFNVKGVAINVTWNTRYNDGVYLDSPFVNSIVNVNGGRYKTTGGTIVQKKANGADGGTAVLNIAGGYFNEKSGTTFKDQIATYVADTSEINTLDPLLEGIYKYEVAPHYVAKVKTGSTTTNYTTIKAAFDYAKTVSNPTITLLDNCTLTSGGDATYNRFNANSWTGTLDLNGYTLTPTFDGDGRAFTVSGTNSKLTITDNSGAKGGKIYYQGPSTGTVIFIVVGGSAEVELASGTLYVEVTSADKVVNGFVVDGSSTKFTQSGGTFTIKAKHQAQGYYGSGTATLTGGKMNVEGETSQAIGLHPNTATSVLNVSGTFELDAKSGNQAYAVYAQDGTATIGGTADIYAESPTRARVLQGTSSGNLTVNGGTFEANGTTASQSDCYVLIPEGSSTMTINGGKFKNNQNNFLSKGADASLTINGGYFNEYTTGTNHKTQINGKKGSGKVVLDLDTDDAEYIAGYRYLVTDDPVAKVKIGDAVTYYTTVAAAFTAANAATSASTITMLKDATATSYLHYTGSQNCTLDLNGHTISYDGTTTEHRLLRINHEDITFTVTDNTVSKEGKLLFNTSKESTSYGVVVIAGNFQLDAGTIEMHASGGTAEGVTPYKSGTSVTINGGKVYVVTTNSKPGHGAYSKNGTTTINGGTIQVEAAGAGYGIYYSAGTTTVTDGKFNISGSTAYATNQSAANANMIIQGGWYTTNTHLKPNAPYQVLSLADQSPYLYEVAEAYTLTWTTDGDPLTGSYTSGLTKPGTTITAPNTPTKTGYTFSAWTPAVAATMPAANTEYTATWTINSFDVTFNMQGHGAAIAKQTIDYNGLVTEPATPTEANYVFGGWYKEAGCTNAWNFDEDHVTAATTLYAKWTAAVASVTVGGATTYYATMADAYAAANEAAAAPTITVLQDVEGISEKLSYTGSNNCTLDLNGHTVAGVVSQLLYINKSDITFTIENTGGSENGKISLEIEGSAATYCVYVNNGTLQLNAGTIYHHSTQTAKSAYAVYVKASKAFTMNGGKVHVVTTTRPAIGVYSLGTTNIKGGTIKVESASTGYGIDAPYKTTKVYALATIDVTGTTACGARVGGYAGAGSYNGNLIIEGGTFDVTASSGIAAGVVAYTGTYTKDEVTYHTAGTANIRGGEFIVHTSKASKNAYGVYVHEALTDPDATPMATVTGGKFKVTAMTPANANAVNTDAANTALLMQGGYYNINTNLSGYVAPTKSCNYYCLSTTAADKASVGSDYNYKVAEAYTLTWNLDGGTVTTAGTGAAVDATGTPSIAWGVGDAITAPTIVRDGYTFAAWTPAVAETMPAANTTYTAQWAVASVTTNDVTTLYTNMTAAWTAANTATAASTLTLLQDVTVNSQLTYNNSNNMNCTLDLNGHTLTSNTSEQSPLHINNTNVTFTVTDGTVDKSGKLSMTSTYSEKAIFGAYAQNGNLVLEAGTIEVISGTKTTCGVTALTTGTFTMNGGTIHVVATNGQIGRGLYFNGTMTVNSGTIHVEAAGDGYGIFRDNSSGTATVNDGKFNITSSSGTPNITNQANNTYVKIYGGYYNINSNLATCVAAPYHIFDLTSGTEYDEGYHYEVAEGYTLTWNLGGGTVTAAGTAAAVDATGTPNAYVKAGASITAPTVTRTGYTFSAWSPAVAATMPAANTTYTATWTAKSCTVTFDKEGGSGGDNNATATYDAAMPTVTPPTKTNYVFAGYWDGDNGTGTQYYNANGTSARTWDKAINTTLYAKWLEAVASVTVSGVTTNYTTLKAAFDYAKTQNNAEVTLLKDVVSTSTYTWAPSSAISNTFDLNGHSLSSTAGTVLGVGKAGATLTIKDTPGGGSISYSSTTGGWSPTVHVGNGKLILQSGTISRATDDGVAVGVQAYTTADATPEFEMTGGKVETSAVTYAYSVLVKSTGSNYATATISGGEVSATATGTYAFALTAAQKGNITVKGTNNPKISATDATIGTQVARNEGDGATFTIEGGLFKASRNASPFSGTVSISGGYFNEYGSTTTYKTQIESRCVSPKHPIALTAAEQAALGEGGTDYKYKVVDAYTLTWNLDGGSVTSAGTPAGYVEVGTTVTAPTVTKAGYTFNVWSPAVVSPMPASDVTYTATWTPEALTFTGATNSLWSTASNWTPACVPTSAHDIYIQKPCSVDIDRAEAKSIVIRNGYSDYTGKLTVGSNKGLNVDGTITKTTNGSNSLATSPSDLVLESSAAGNASLIFDNQAIGGGTNYAQAMVEMYSKAEYNANAGTVTWQYIGVPFSGESSAKSLYYGCWIYEWLNDCSGWGAVANGGVVNPWTGYCITQSAATTYDMQGKLLPTDYVSTTVPAGKEKVFANSWTAPIQIKQLRDADFGDMEKTVYKFNTGFDDDNNGAVGNTQSAAGTYRSIPIHASPYTGDSVISSMQGFYVRNTAETNQTLQLSYDNHVRPARTTDAIINGPMLAPQRISAESENTERPTVMKLITAGSRYYADIVLLAREDFSQAYDDGWDGENLNEAGEAPLVYALREDGTKDAVSAIPYFEGTVVGFHTGEDNLYTVSFVYDGDEILYLNDLQEQESTLISEGNTYSFWTSENDAEARFIISATPIAKTPTGVEGADANGNTVVRKVIINDKVYIIRGGRMYSVVGGLVK